MPDTVYPQENIYNHLPKEEASAEKPPRYISKFRPMVVLEKKSTKSAMKTMGPAKAEIPSPEKYLKKHSKEPKLSDKAQSSKEVHHTCTTRKPAIPARTDKPPMGVYTKRDFIQTTVPKKPQHACVDSYKGHKELLDNSGLVPKYVKKKDYGEVPEYLQQHNKEVQRAREEYEKLMEEQKEQTAMKVISGEERQAILETLKKNWDKLHQDYQRLPLVTDTLSKKARKEQLEASMKKLEKDIDLIERFQTIYIVELN